tara:strand:- start:64097 stop:64348 length:252 start_codon:yes stop_codon:yes gene_type:complete
MDNNVQDQLNQLENETKELSRDIVRLQKNNKNLAEMNNALINLIGSKLGITEISDINEFLKEADSRLTDSNNKEKAKGKNENS